mgnify:FL=1
MSSDPSSVLFTPDGRYLIVRGRLWRATNPSLDPDEKQHHVALLMAARRHLKGEGDASIRAAARQSVQAAKVALGERGPVWWTDGAPDWNRHMVHLSPYAQWYTQLLAVRIQAVGQVTACADQGTAS